MWQPDNKQAFLVALTAPVQQYAVKIEVLDTDFQVISTIHDNACGCSPNDQLIDGAVDLDVSRGSRRTVTLSLLNKNGAFAPGVSDWTGIFYVNRLFRAYRGVVIADGTPVYVPVGTFMVDKAEVLVENNVSTVVIQGSDLWKKLSKAQFTTPGSFTSGTLLNDIINQIIRDSGITRSAIDPLSERTTQTDRLGASISYEKGDNKGEFLQKLANDWGLQVYFDPMGRFISEDFRNPMTRPVVWTYSTSDGTPNLAYSLRSATDDDRLYNHTYVTATGGDQVSFGEVIDNDPRSPTNVDKIGDRTYRMESGVLTNSAQAQQAAQTLFYSHFLIQHKVDLEAVCNPLFEGNDVIRVEEPRFTGLNDTFLIASLSVPLNGSKQKISMNRVINVNVQ